MSEKYYPCTLCGASVKEGEQGKHLLTTCSHTRPDFVNKADLVSAILEAVEGLQRFDHDSDYVGVKEYPDGRFVSYKKVLSAIDGVK